MTTSDEPLTEMQRMQANTMRGFLELLNEISALGVQKFAEVIDSASLADLQLLAQSVATVRAQIAKHQAQHA